MTADRLFDVDATGTRWRLSAAWATKRIDCTIRGITRDGGCGGSCCRTMSFWPPRAGNTDGACDHLGPDGCRLGPDRPLTCHLYPFRIKSSGTIVLHHAGAVLGNQCGGCRGHGPRIIDAIAPSLRVVFGDGATDNVLDAINAGNDATLDVPSHILAALAEEGAWEDDNIVPIPRDWTTGLTRQKGESP